MVTVALGMEGVLIVLLALAVKERSYRLTRFVHASALRCESSAERRVGNGGPRQSTLLHYSRRGRFGFVSFLYTKYREAIRQFL